MRFAAHDLLQATNRNTSNKKSYILFKTALERLRSTSIQTNIKMGETETLRGFGFIDSYEVVRETRDGRMQAIEITLSDWLFNAIDAKGDQILTISRQYFQLRKPLERRLYEIARKHCGQNSKWQCGLVKLQKKAGSQSTLKEFRRMLKAIVEMNQKKKHIPDYSFELDKDLFIVHPRSEFTDMYSEPEKPCALDKVIIRQSGMETARKFAAGYDLYFLEGEWRDMLAAKKSIPESPEGSFVSYVKWYVGKHGAA